MARETYKVLPGAHNNAGGRYEYFLSSYVALKLLHTSTSNFKISNNCQEFGKFDDVIVEVEKGEEENRAVETWTVQLKHGEKAKLITRDELASATGDFGIVKYFEDYQKRHPPANTKSVIFTNRKFEKNKSFRLKDKPYNLTPFESPTACPFDTSKKKEVCSVFQFAIKPKAEPAEDPEEFRNFQMFLETFYLVANQKCVGEFDRKVAKLFNKVLGSVGVAHYDAYKKFFQTDWEKTGRKEKLYREDIEREVVRIVLGPYARPTIDLSGAEDTKKNNKRKAVLKTIISQFDVSLVDADCEEVIANLWQRSDSDIPLIVEVSEARADSIYKILSVLTPGRFKFFLVGGDCLDPDKMPNWKVFENLSNLASDDYKTVTDKFSCIVQGRKKTCLGRILKNNKKLNSFIQVGHLLRMIDNNKPFVIGDETVKLPVPYIHRSVPKHVFGCDLIGNLVHGDVLVISCGNVKKLLATVNKHKHDTTKVVDITDRHFIIDPIQSNEKSVTRIILISKKRCSLRKFSEICFAIEDERSVLNFEFCDNSLNLLSTHGELSKFIKFRAENTDKIIIRESEILTNFLNKTNVLLADPGMGKTVCGDFIKRVCPFDAWPVKINLREKMSFFTSFTNVQDLLAKILDIDQPDSIKRRFQDYYKNDKQLMLIWDGLDEVIGIENVELVLSKIKEISHDTRHYQCITSRYHLQDKLESFFNVLSITLTEITSRDQRKYIEKGLREIYPETIRAVTNDIQKRIVKNNLNDMLGIPLLLNMFTTIFSKPDNYEKIRENELSLIQIYGMFIDGKIDNHFKGKAANSDNTLSLQTFNKLKAWHLTNYPKAALITCFGNDFVKKLNLNSDDFVRFCQEIAKTGDVIGLITIITDNNMPSFLHRTFAEYFAALYLTEEYEQLGSELLNKLLFRPENRNIRFLFDMCLSEDHPAHRAVLAMNLDKLKEIGEKNKDMVFRQDEGGRTVLHLACSYGTSRQPLRCLDFAYHGSRWCSASDSDIKYFDATPLHFLEEENKDYKNIVNYLVSLVDQKTINDTDKIYGLNCLGYADASLSLYAIESLLKICEVRRENLQHFLCNYKDTETLVTYSILLNYNNLSSLIDRIPYFEFFELNSLKWPQRVSNKNCLELLGGRNETVMIETKIYDVKFENLTAYNILILIIEFGCIDLLRKVNVANVNLMKNRTILSYINMKVHYHKIDPLVWTVFKGNLDIFKLLLRHKPDLKKIYGEYGNILHIAVELRHTNIVKHIIDETLIEIDSRNQIEETPLLIASKVGILDILSYLIAKGANVDATNLNGENLFHIACKEGHFEIVQYLLENCKILQETLDSTNNTPMLTAASYGRFDIVQYLLENGVNCQTKNPIGFNVLHYACWEGNLQFIKRLTKANLIELDTQDLIGFNPLLIAGLNCHFAIVEYLLENGIDFKTKNIYGENVLHYVCQKGDSSIIKRLKKKNLIEIDTEDCDGFDLLLTAASSNRFDIVEYLLENGVDFQTKYRYYGTNVLRQTGDLPSVKRLTKKNLIELDTQEDWNGSASGKRFDIVEYLLEKGVNCKAKNKYGENVLHYACLQGNLSFIKCLTKENLIELDTQENGNGLNPLLIAASEKRFDIVEYFLENGVNCNVINNCGENVLHYACFEGNLSFIKCLTKENLIELDIQEHRYDMNPLLMAVSRNHFDIVEYLLENGVNYKAKNIVGENVLHYACWKGNLPLIKRLTKENLIELDTYDYDGFNPLLIAACGKRFDIAEHLLENGVNCNAKTKCGENILHYACFEGNLPFIKCLKKENLNELDTQVDQNGLNPLLIAHLKKHFDIVEYLLKNCQAKNKYGKNVLHYACLKGNLSFIKSLTREDLIELDTQADSNGLNPLLLAASEKRFDIVEYLLEKGVNCKAKNKHGENVLHYALLQGNLSFIKCLTKANLIELDTQENQNGLNPLLMAASRNHFDIVEYLLEKGVNHTTKNKDRENVLHYACWKGNLPFIRRLKKDYLMELDTRDCDGDSPLLIAASENRFDIVEYLLANDAKFKTKNKDGENLLHYACWKGNLPFIERLTKEHLRQLDIPDGKGFNNPLLIAASENRFDIVKHLLENGANFKIKNIHNQNILHFAAKHGVSREFLKSYLQPKDWNKLNKNKKH